MCIRDSRWSKRMEELKSLTRESTALEKRPFQSCSAIVIVPLSRKVSLSYGKLFLRTTSPSSSLCSMPPLLVGEALAYHRVFGGWRFAPVCPAAGIGFGASAIIAKNKSSAKGSPTRGAAKRQRRLRGCTETGLTTSIHFLYKRQSRRRGKRSCGGAAGNYAGFGTPL